jgi:hypothetical protein
MVIGGRTGDGEPFYEEAAPCGMAAARVLPQRLSELRELR